MPKMVVMANGCFDPLHYGHLLHLKSARAMGGVLVVAVTSDESVRREKGDGRPLFSALQRSELLQAIRCVDWTLIVDSSLEALQLVKPRVFVKGPDYAGKIGKDVAEFCRERKIAVRFTAGTKWSATDIGNELRRG